MKTRTLLAACMLAASLFLPGSIYADPADPQLSPEGPAAGGRIYVPFLKKAVLPPPAPTPAAGLAYWGIAMADVPWDMAKLANVENAAGKTVSIVHYWQFWSQDGAPLKFATRPANNVRDHGAIPMISWPPMKMGGGTAQGDFQLVDIINGSYDGYIRQWAIDAKAWGSPFFLRLAHEMNGDWFPWSETANGNGRGQFVQAWRRIHDIFTSVGAKNATWVWCPNIDFAGSPRPTYASLYPGDSYVDWTCLDGYNWGPAYPKNGGWISFKDLFGYSYNELLKVAPSKPVMIGEFASTEAGGSKGDWIADALKTQIPSAFPQIRAHIWFNRAMDGMDWPIDSSQNALSAFRSSITSPHYLPAQPGAYKTSPIPAP